MSSLENALLIIRLLDEHRPILRVGEVCRLLKMPKSTVSRLLRSLQEGDFLEREVGGAGYSVGPRVVTLASLYSSRHSLLALAEKAVDDLVAQFGFTGYLSVLSGPDIVLLQVKQGSYPLRYVRPVGARLPATQTVMGHALLSRLNNDELIQHLPKDFSVQSTISRTIRRKLDAARRERVVVGPSVLNIGITTLGVALCNPVDGNLIALGLAFPERACDAALLRRMKAELTTFARQIGQRIGDPFWCVPHASRQSV